MVKTKLTPFVSRVAEGAVLAEISFVRFIVTVAGDTFSIRGSVDI